MDDETFFRALAMQAALAQGLRDDIVHQRATAYAGLIEAFARHRAEVPLPRQLGRRPRKNDTT
jgi:hypothetical protein